MPKVSPIQTDFTAGEFSPLLNGRVDIDRYKSGLDTCLNFMPTLQGGLTRRPGTEFISEVKDSTTEVRLVAFEFSTTQAYILEFGDQYIRFYRNYGQIQSAGSAYEISSPWLEADLFQLNFAQSADVLYIVHPDYPPRKLSRTGHTSWTLTQIDFNDGPYLPINAVSTTMTPSAATGTVTVTASSVTGINGDSGFQASDVGRYIRMREGTTWGWGEITAVGSTTTATVVVESTFTNTNAKTFWRLGLWSDTTGYPATVTFHEDRLAFAGTPDYPQRIDLSESGSYESFPPSELDDEVLDSNALSFSFNATDVNVVRWLISDEKALVAGTIGGEWIVRPSSQSEALTPANITAKRSTTYGSANLQAIQVGKAGLFVQRAGRKIRELTYYFDVDGFRATDLTVLAEHVTETGIKQMTLTKEPQPILWCVREDGVLAALTYERDVDSFKAGWHRHIIGGQSDAAGSEAIVESVASIPSQDGFREDLWMVVRREINGATVRYIEYLTKIFDDETEQRDAFFVDCGLTYDSPLTISGATKADPCVLTITSHGLSTGDKILITGVKGMVELNSNSYLVTSASANTVELTDLEGNNIDSQTYTTYVSGGEAREYVSNISGLTHLEGEVISILADGAVQPNKTVSSGAVTLTTPATTVHFGLSYNSDGKMLRINAGAGDGTAMGKTRRIHRVGYMFHRTLGFKHGLSFDDLEELTFRTGADLLTRAPALFTGIRSETIEADYDFENQICFRQDSPLPCTILAIMPQMHTQDR